MTTNVTVKASCSADTEVEVAVNTDDGVDVSILQDGENMTVSVYDDKAVHVCERKKAVVQSAA